MAVSPVQADTTALRAHLRRATQSAHHRLDHHPLLAPLIRPGLHKAQYGQALQALYACQHAMQEGVAPLWQNNSINKPPFEAPNRLTALAQDLAQLHLLPWPSHQANAFAKGHTLTAQIGTLYVLEGAALGGQMIARCVRQQYADTLPLAFFAGDAADPQLRWSAFFQWAQIACQPDQWDAVSHVAVQVFESIIAHFDACHAA